jgi:hypothetical protein
MYLSVQLFNNIPECKEKVTFWYWKTGEKEKCSGLGGRTQGLPSQRTRLLKSRAATDRISRVFTAGMRSATHCSATTYRIEN